MSEETAKIPKVPRAVRTGAVDLIKDDSSCKPSTVEDRNYLYLATAKPEMTMLSGQWEVAAGFAQLDNFWSKATKTYPQELSGITVVKCPTMRHFYQQHKGHHENFYREVAESTGQIAFYVRDCSDVANLKRTYKALREAYGTAKLSFTLHEKILSKRDSGFILVDEQKRLRFSEHLYVSFCQRNLVVPKELKHKDKAFFKHRFAGIYEFDQLPERFVVLDTETTGMDHVQGNVTEIGAIVVSKADLQVKESFEQLIRIDGKVDWYITKLTGITNKLLAEQGKPAKETLLRLRAFVKDMPIVAHNAKFDKGFVDMEFLKNGLPLLNNRWIDSIDIFHNHLPNRPSYALSALANELLDDFQQAHRAVADVLTVLKVMQKIPVQQKEKDGPEHKPS